MKAAASMSRASLQTQPGLEVRVEDGPEVYHPPSPPDVVHASDSQEAVLPGASAPGLAPTFATYYPTSSPVDQDGLTAPDLSSLDYYAAQAPPRSRTVSPIPVAQAPYAAPVAQQQAYGQDVVMAGQVPVQSMQQLHSQAPVSVPAQAGAMPAPSQVYYTNSFPTVQESIAQASLPSNSNFFYTNSVPGDQGTINGTIKQEVDEPMTAMATAPKESRPSIVRVLTCLICFLLLLIIIVGVAVGVSVQKQTVTVTTTVEAPATNAAAPRTVFVTTTVVAPATAAPSTFSTVTTSAAASSSP